MLYILILAGTVVCAIGAIAARRLITSALWLAGASALVALFMYLLGAHEVAVIELSVGAGLVTVLFVFAINIAGEEPLLLHPLLPRPLAWGLILVALVLFGWVTIPNLLNITPTESTSTFLQVMWQDRQMDILLQIMLIFAGVMGVIGLLSDQPNTTAMLHAGEFPAIIEDKEKHE
ncbi:MAG TPA: NADH-quinone oxidoreductase subunit J [Anaerolineaceae bacterium]|nr:NADH-quinone oxidoreductase subunit J [Anaerolineaceae bacterium]